MWVWKTKKTSFVQKRCFYENGKYLESITADSVIMCNGMIELTKTDPAKTISTKLFQWILREQR